MSGYVAPTLTTSYLGGPIDGSNPTASVTIASGDILVLLAETSDSLRTLSTPTGGTGITWTLQRSSVNTSFGNMYLWTATAPSSQSYTQTVPASGGNVGAKEAAFRLYRYTGSGGIGNTNITHAATGTPSLTVTQAQDNSVLVWHNIDWNDLTPGTPTYLTSGVGSNTQDYLNKSTEATYYHDRANSPGTAGSKTVGMTTPTGQSWTICVCEVKGVYVDNTAPSVPTGVTATPNSNSQITVSWTPSTDDVGVASYRVQRGGVTITGGGAVVGTSIAETGLTANTAYSYTVSAVDAAGNRSSESSTASGTTFGPPTVGAGADVTGWSNNATFARTATEAANGATITARAWTISSGPAGVGSTIGTAAALSWVPTVVGTYVLQYAATNTYGTGTDTMSIVVTDFGVKFLTQQLGAASRVGVEVAWGADLTAASATWTWTDITTDVRMNSGIQLKHGRQDEAASIQPATCTVVLNNTTGAYSLGGQSANWPNVRHNTPIRVRIDAGDGLGPILAFIGYADSWQPNWDQSAKVANVTLTASGQLRRLAQNTAPVLSSLRRTLAMDPAVVAYWPLEEGSKATAGYSAIPGAQPMRVLQGEVDWAADTKSFGCSVQSPVLKNGRLQGNVPPYTNTHQWQARVLVAFPASGTGMSNLSPVMSITTSDPTLHFIDVNYDTGGTLQLKAYTDQNVNVFDTGSVSLGPIDGSIVRLILQMQQNGADVTYLFGVQYLDTAYGYTWTGTITGKTLGTATMVNLCTYANHDGLAMGHPVVQNTITDIFGDYGQLSAYVAESAVTRFERLCDENGIEHTQFGDGTGQGGIADLMGVQRPEQLLTLLSDVQAVDRGIITDGQDHGGLVFNCRRALENEAAILIIDASLHKLGGTLVPVNDDQGQINLATVTRTDGSTATFEDTTSTAALGVYSGSLTVNCNSDDAPLQYAAWLVHVGTSDGYRYPGIQLDLAGASDLIPAWLTVRVGYVIYVTNANILLPQHPTGTLQLQVTGFTQTITPYSWDVTVDCVDEVPWWIGRACDTTGDVRATGLHIDTDGSTLAANASIGATTLSVATTTGPLWTTVADDFPFSAQIGGIPVTVTAISGASSPQTFTVSGVTKALTSGQTVSLYQPRPLGL